MRTRTITLSAMAALTALLASPLLPEDYTSALAQSIEIGPGGVRLNPERGVRPEREFRRGPDWRFSERYAVSIEEEQTPGAGLLSLQPVPCFASERNARPARGVTVAADDGPEELRPVEDRSRALRGRRPAGG